MLAATLSTDTEAKLPLPKPCGSFSGVRWYCVVSQPQAEYRALAELLAQGFEAYLPLHLDRDAKRDRVIPLFSRYLFVSFDAARHQWRRICSTRGVSSLIWRSSEVPAPLPTGVVEGLIARTSARRIVDDPGDRFGVAYLGIGARGRVTDGPMAGWEGVCTLSAPGRVRLLMGLFGAPREVEFRASAVENIGG